MILAGAKRRSLYMGLLCASVGALSGLYVSASAIGDGYGIFIVIAPIAAFLSGSLSWWVVMERVHSESLPRAALTGVLATIIGHYLCWYLIFFATFLSHTITKTHDAVSGAPLNPIEALSAAGIYSLFSLLFLGPATVTTGILISIAFTIAQRRKTLSQNQ